MNEINSLKERIAEHFGVKPFNSGFPKIGKSSKIKYPKVMSKEQAYISNPERIITRCGSMNSTEFWSKKSNMIYKKVLTEFVTKKDLQEKLPQFMRTATVSNPFIPPLKLDKPKFASTQSKTFFTDRSTMKRGRNMKSMETDKSERLLSMHLNTTSSSIRNYAEERKRMKKANSLYKEKMKGIIRELKEWDWE